jgi:hypothetical protein
MVEIQISEVVAIPAPFSLAQQWVGIGKDCCVGEEKSRLSVKLVFMVTSHAVFC